MGRRAERFLFSDDGERTAAAAAAVPLFKLPRRRGVRVSLKHLINLQEAPRISCIRVAMVYTRFSQCWWCGNETDASR